MTELRKLTPGKLLALDYGTVRFGFAISDEEQKFSFPLENYNRKNIDQDFQKIIQLIQSESIQGIVIGLPNHLDGRESQKSKEIKKFVQQLITLVSIPIYYFDERFTSTMAEEILWNAGLSHKKRKQKRDSIAAQIILRSYLEAGCPANEWKTFLKENQKLTSDNLTQS